MYRSEKELGKGRYKAWLWVLFCTKKYEDGSDQYLVSQLFISIIYYAVGCGEKLKKNRKERKNMLLEANLCSQFLYSLIAVLNKYFQNNFQSCSDNLCCRERRDMCWGLSSTVHFAIKGCYPIKGHGDTWGPTICASHS